MKFTIITDSSCDLRRADFYSDSFSFISVPINIVVGDKTIVDDESLSTDSLIAEMKLSKSAFKTSAPAPEAFAEEMRKHDNILCITLSSKLSGTYNSARLAAEEVLKESPEKNIAVIDSMSASAGLALILFKLKTFVESGKYNSFSDVADKAAEYRNTTRIRFVLQDLSNLIKSGRMSKIVGLIASTLIIRPICGDNGNGEIKMFSKTIGTKKALTVLSGFPAEKIESEGTAFPIIVSHCHNFADADFLKKSMFESGLNLKNITIYPMRGIASLFAGEKGLALAY